MMIHGNVSCSRRVALILMIVSRYVATMFAIIWLGRPMAFVFIHIYKNKGVLTMWGDSCEYRLSNGTGTVVEDSVLRDDVFH